MPISRSAKYDLQQLKAAINGGDLMVIKTRVEDLDLDADPKFKLILRARDIPFNKIKNEEVKEYLAKIALIAELKYECDLCLKNMKSLSKKGGYEQVDDPKAKKEFRNQQKHEDVKKLASKLHYNRSDESLENFKKAFHQFEQKYQSKSKTAFSAFLKVVKAIITGGVYAIVRGKALESHQFWKTARHSFEDKTKKHIEKHEKKVLPKKT